MKSKAKRILLVDDDPAVSFITQRLFRQAQLEAEVLLASHGQEALDIVREVCRSEQCPELILLDINMPVMDGFEFLEELQKSADLSSAPIKIVMLSSSTHYLDMVKAKDYPVIGCIEKPLTVEKLSKFL
ncbi:response regulator [Pontibacter silvestris]|uniref:Response regulator n=1 Tax=Pontibacter silvestris TaxID=2305183 RepID=A0ABW4WWT4_9BACT|nr:response regulator [Pontibacter silvestris]MCC9136601.1 response regulator [Pontibacter silvestris]